MTREIMNGFPLRRCSWAYVPVAPLVATRRMIRWLDTVCSARVATRHPMDRLRIVPASGGSNHEA